jgi:TetR/AcrR family transcriptional regulator, transcriptional repressor for nem operon
LPATGDEDIGAFCCESFGDGESDAGGASRDNGHFALEYFGHLKSDQVRPAVIDQLVHNLAVLDHPVKNGYAGVVARPREFDETEVLLAARERFWSTGYAATTLDDVLAATGLGKGSLYGAFGDKHQLFLRTFGDHSTALVEAVRRALDGPDADAYQRLRAHVLAVANATASDVCRRGCLLAKGTAELSEHDPAVAATARKTFAAIEELLASCIAGAQRAGDIRQDADPARLAGLLLAVLRGIEALGKGGSSPDSLRAIAETALAVLPMP